MTNHSILWQQNPLLIQLIGLSPLLAMSQSVVTGLTMGVCLMLVFVLASLIVSATRLLVPEPAAMAVYVVITASIVTVIDLLMQTYRPELRSDLGLYLLIIAANCLLLDRLYIFAAQNKVAVALRDALWHGGAILLIICVLSAFREAVGTGALFANMSLLFGEKLTWQGWQFAEQIGGLKLAVLPAGAFISLGLLIALRSIFKKYE